MKRIYLDLVSRYCAVAPRRGAWVETWTCSWSPISPVVAPRRGAWVETVIRSKNDRLTMSRTPQGCVG